MSIPICSRCEAPTYQRGKRCYACQHQRSKEIRAGAQRERPGRKPGGDPEISEAICTSLPEVTAQSPVPLALRETLLAFWRSDERRYSS